MCFLKIFMPKITNPKKDSSIRPASPRVQFYVVFGLVLVLSLSKCIVKYDSMTKTNISVTFIFSCLCLCLVLCFCLRFSHLMLDDMDIAQSHVMATFTLLEVEHPVTNAFRN